MNARLAVSASVIALSLIACTTQKDGPEADADGTWVGTVTTDGNVTTVVNESGSVWGGTATLVEEASIGVAAGADEYMLGSIHGLFATEDEIYVSDAESAMVRVYDFAGDHLRSFGGPGQGPGEFSRYGVQVFVAPDGRSFVEGFRNARINMYSRAGEPDGEISYGAQARCCTAQLAVTPDGGMWLRFFEILDDGTGIKEGVRLFTAEGPVGETRWVPDLEYESRTIPSGQGEVESVPYAAQILWSLAYDGSMVVGASGRYEFRVVEPDGRTVLVEKYWEPTPVSSEEADWWYRFVKGLMGPRAAEWTGDNIPTHKPAYRQLVPALTGEIWVLREAPGEIEGCVISVEDVLADNLRSSVCASRGSIVDVFADDGRFLGEVTGLPVLAEGGFNGAFAGGLPPFINGDTVLAVTQNDAGTIMVKRYRLVLPGEE